MIRNIQHLKEFGIFRNHTNDSVKDFGKYNLFYGWNGSGKSTLSELFRSIEHKSTYNKFSSAKFKLNLNDGSAITENNISTSNLNIYTFNESFINENISWSSVVKSILLVDETKIKERKKLEELIDLQKYDLTFHSKENKEIEALKNNISKFETNSARHIRTSLQSIDTSDNYYLNYDKRRFETFVSNNLDKNFLDIPVYDDKKVIELTNAAKPEKKAQIEFVPKKISKETFFKAKERLDDLLKTSVISKTIRRLVENDDIKSWVEEGFELHKKHDADKCEFCGNIVTAERIEKLDGHFNDDYKDFQNRLIKANDWLIDQYILPVTLPAASDFYDELKSKYDHACISLCEAQASLNEEITGWHDVLKEKMANPLNVELTVNPISGATVTKFNDAMEAIDSAIKKHNHKSKNFTEETTKAKKQLEKHYVTVEVKNFGYQDKKMEVRDRSTANKNLKRIIETRQTEIRELESSLSNESLGADQFNKSLHKFLGRSELTLRFNQQSKGYEILRNGSDPVDGNLSEGEKTAIAFVYFITKLRENDNNIENTIVVLDDPISSFDSNHLFHAYSFMKLNCEKAKQLFVLTHNFTFFKLTRDWIARKNKKDNQNISNFYIVKESGEQPRMSTYTNADKSLINYNSEYHYIFSRLYSLKNQTLLEMDEHFLAANLSRKLLEAFLAFKFPKNRGNFSNLMDAAAANCKNLEDEKKEKIRKFINEHSHNDLIETNEDFVEGVLGEGVSVISDVFFWIKELDKQHYNEMVQVVS